MRKWLRQLFTFTTGERNGILVLVFLCLFAFVLPSIYFYFKPVEHTSNPQYEKEVNQFIAEYNQKNGLQEIEEEETVVDSTGAVVTQKRTKSSSKEENASTLKININTAGAEEFERLRGIGPVISKRIVKFRNLLGGFAAVEQLKEVYGLPKATYQKISAQLIVIPNQVKQININTAGSKELDAHPYFKRSAEAIELYRKQHGPYKQVSDLKNITGVTDSLYGKMVPYATVK